VFVVGRWGYAANRGQEEILPRRGVLLGLTEHGFGAGAPTVEEGTDEQAIDTMHCIAQARFCIFAYREKNMATGGENFNKTGFQYTQRKGNKREVILPTNLMTWPVAHGQRHGYIQLSPSFIKLLCLMFESGIFELSVTLISSSYGGNRCAHLPHIMFISCQELIIILGNG
jgi:hypothetical protein